MKIYGLEYNGTYNFDESKVPDYTVPSPIMFPDGSKIKSAEEWTNIRFNQIFESYKLMHGSPLPAPNRISLRTISKKNNALNGIAVQKEIQITCSMTSGVSKSFKMLLYYPNNGNGPFPAFIGLNGTGNHSTTNDEDVAITQAPVIDHGVLKLHADSPPGENTRGAAVEPWAFEQRVKCGFACATICSGEIFPDSPVGFKDSIYRLFYSPEELEARQKKFGAVGGWAWALSRALDVLENEPEVDSKRIAVHGHSRLGKAALWAGACDRRFALVISNESGCCGASLLRRIYGENLELLLFFRTYWFSTELKKYIGREHELPFDQNFMISLIAPRPVYIASADGDQHSDPKGEFLSAYHAGEVYNLFGLKGIDSAEAPPLNTPIGDSIAYHIRSGEHGVTSFDWKCYMDFANRHLKR